MFSRAAARVLKPSTSRSFVTRSGIKRSADHGDHGNHPFWDQVPFKKGTAFFWTFGLVIGFWAILDGVCYIQQKRNGFLK